MNRHAAQALRLLFAVAAFSFLMTTSFVFAIGASWTFTPLGLERLMESVLPLVSSFALGIGAVAAARAILDLRVRSWWLLLALPIPGLMALNVAGVIGAAS